LKGKIGRIRKVGNLELGNLVTLEGEEGIITSFPSRHMIIVENINPRDGVWSSAKTVVRKVSKIQ